MSDIALVAKTLFDGVWSILVETAFPGTDFSLAALIIAVMIIGFAIRIFGYLTGFTMGDATYGRISDLRGKLKATAAKVEHKRWSDAYKQRNGRS